MADKFSEEHCGNWVWSRNWALGGGVGRSCGLLALFLNLDELPHMRSYSVVTTWIELATKPDAPRLQLTPNAIRDVAIAAFKVAQRVQSEQSLMVKCINALGALAIDSEDLVADVTRKIGTLMLLAPASNVVHEACAVSLWKVWRARQMVLGLSFSGVAPDSDAHSVVLDNEFHAGHEFLAG